MLDRVEFFELIPHSFSPGHAPREAAHTAQRSNDNRGAKKQHVGVVETSQIIPVPHLSTLESLKSI